MTKVKSKEPFKILVVQAFTETGYLILDAELARI
jgi:hypothetical protein